MEAKKISLENLSKEDLLQRYRNLLAIAQKAKAAKDEAQEEIKQLKQEVETCKEKEKKLSSAEAENAEKEVQLESLRRQLCRAEADCSVLESQLETLDTENRRLSQVANNAEMQLRLGTEIRQDALEGMGEELANVKNTAVEALAERDSLRARLREQNTNSSDAEVDLAQAQISPCHNVANFQTLETCQAKIQGLRTSQAELRLDIISMQTAAKAMATELEEALSKAQEASEEAARLRSKDLMAEMNEAMKTRGEVAAQLAEKLGAVEKERDGLREEKKRTEEQMKKLSDEMELLKREKESVLEKLELTEKDLQAAQKSKAETLEQVEHLSEELQSSRHCCAELEEKLSIKSEEINDVNNEFTKLQANFEDFKANNYENNKEIEKLEDKCRQLIEINKEKDSLLDGIQLKIADAEADSSNSNSLSAEVEMKNEEITALKSRLHIQEERILHLDENNNQLLQKVADLEQLKNKHNEDSSNFEQFKLTLEKKIADESSRVKALESEKSSLEQSLLESNNKIGLLDHDKNALTAKIADMDKEIAEVKSQSIELQDQVASLKDKIAELEKDDGGEAGSVSTVSRADDAARLKDVEESFEDRYMKLKAVAIKMKQKCQEQANLLAKLATEKTEMQSKVTSALKEKDNLARNLQSMQAACDKSADDAEVARDKLKDTEKQLTRAGEELAKSRSQFVEATDKIAVVEAKLKQTKDELESARSEIKRTSVISLEMAAYEKSATEQDRKMKDMSKELETLRAQLECHRKIAQESKTSASDLEEKLTALKSDKDKLSEDLSQRKNHSQELESKLAEKVQKLSESEANFEAQRAQLEKIELQLAMVSAEKIRLDKESSRFKEQVARQIRMLEEEVSSAKLAVMDKDAEVAKVQNEFEGYKVRAQAVLIKAQQQQPPREEKDPEEESEMSILKSTVERLQTALCDASCKEKALQVEISSISGQFAESQSTTRRLIEQISELNVRNEEIAASLKKAEDALKDANRKHKLAADTLASSYKQQLIEAETRHKAQMAALIEERREQVITEEITPVSLQKREEGEGSENVDSVKGNTSSNSRDPIPLERLLSSSSDFQDDAKSEVSYDAQSMSSAMASERRVKHLAALLGEAEADLARLTHQNAILKEEIRRQQRCAERLQHTEKNGEYLKNVVLKFVTLQGGDERARLVPVLNTILKFSPEELQQLNTVASPTTPTSPTTTQGGWSSYLPLWSGTH